jgi:metacaspase-1
MATKKPAGAGKGISVHIGLNAVSAAHYGGWSGDLAACEFDANDMNAIARAKAMKSTVLLTKKATRAAALAAIRAAAKACKSGDLFFLSYSGHGGQVPDTNGDEPDGQDETWCLYDGQLIDDELYLELSRFAAGVRILVLSDSCHSGSVIRDVPPTVAIVPTAPQRPKNMPRSVGLRTYRDNQAFYDKLQADVAKAAGDKVIDPDAALAHVVASSRLTSIVKNFRASAILVSGCQDNQTSMDGLHNGAFTEQVLNVWNNGSYKGSYATFHAAVRSRMAPTQSPNLFTLGKAAGAFLAQTPFSL